MNATCQHCGAHYRIPDEKIGGKRVKVTCKKCHEQFIVVGPHRRPSDAFGEVKPASDVPLDETVPDQDQKLPPPLPTQIEKKTWRVATANGEQHGPYSEQELERLLRTNAGEVQLVWKPGFDEWRNPEEVEELYHLFEPPPVEAQMYQKRVEEVEREREEHDLRPSTNFYQRKDSSKKNFYLLIVVAIGLIGGLVYAFFPMIKKPLIYFGMVAILLGMVSPHHVILWGEKEEKTRGKVILYYGSFIFIFFVTSFTIFTLTEYKEESSSSTQQAVKRPVEEQAKEPSSSTQQVVKRPIEEQAKEPDIQQESPPEKAYINEVYLYPEDYVGKTLIFDLATVDMDIKKDEDYFLVGVTSYEGKYVFYVLSSEGFSFVLPPEMAKSLSKKFASDISVKAKLTCYIERIPGRIPGMIPGISGMQKRYIAVIKNIEFYDPVGFAKAEIEYVKENIEKVR